MPPSSPGAGSDPVHEPATPAVPGDGPGARADARADEDAAADARLRYHSERMPALGPDPVIAPLLAPDESVVAVWRSVGFERRPASSERPVAGHGDLYLTSGRLLVVGASTVEVGLLDIDEAMLCGGRLLLVLHDGAGIAVEVRFPQLLRVEIATARAAART